MFYPLIDVATWYNYTPRKWLDTILATNGTVDLFRQELTYDDAGYITKQNSKHGGSPWLLQQYTNDAIGQLKTWTPDPFNPSGATTEAYSYDLVGNRTNLTITNGPLATVVENRQYGIGPNPANPMAGPNQLLTLNATDGNNNPIGGTTYIYDTDGSMTSRTMSDPLGTPMLTERYGYSSWRGLTTTYEREDLMAPPGGPAMIWGWGYRYNAMGEREQKREFQNPGGGQGFSWTYYLLNGTNEQLSVWEGAESATANTCTWLSGNVVYLAPTEYLTYGLRSECPSIRTDLDGLVTYQVTDHLSSVRQTLNNSGNTVNKIDYKPFGEVLNAWYPERIGFNSRQHDDEDGMSNNGVRKLDESLGRFVCVDPLWDRFVGLSPYNYVKNTPLMYVDPTGEVMRLVWTEMVDGEAIERHHDYNPTESYSGTNEFVKQFYAAMAYIQQGNVNYRVAKAIDYLTNMTHIMNIKEIGNVVGQVAWYHFDGHQNAVD